MTKTLIVGAQKAGSTSTQYFLSRFFSTSMDETADYADLLTSGHELFKDPRLVGSARRQEQFAETMQGFNGDLVCIFMWRHPIERFLSSYFHSISYGIVPHISIKRYIRMYGDGELVDRFPTFPRILEPLLFSRYSEGLKFLSQTPGVKVIACDFKKMVDSPVYRYSLLAQLGVPVSSGLLDLNLPHEQKSPKGHLASVVAKRSRSMNHLLSPEGARRLSVSRMRESGANALMALSARLSTNSPLSDQAERHLDGIFEEDHRRTMEILDGVHERPLLL